MRLSVIIPAYNEAKRIPKTLREVSNYLLHQDYDYEILVVNDGSKDDTAEVVASLNKEVPHLRLIDNKKNHGKGYVVRQGMLEAEGDFRLFMDADNATTIDHIEGMWEQLEQGKQVIICSRDIAESVITVPQAFWRRKLGDVFNLIVQITSGLWGLWDTQCGFKGFTAIAVADIFPQTKIDRWAFDVEVLVIAKRMGYDIQEIPVRWVNDPDSKVRLKGMIQMLLEVVQIRINTLVGAYGKK